MYFDKFNFVPLRAVFGEAQIEAYKARLQDHELVEGAMSFYESRPDLTDGQILKTWDSIGGSRAADRETDDPVVLWFQVKAEMRVVSMVLTYSDPLGPHW